MWRPNLYSLSFGAGVSVPLVRICSMDLNRTLIASISARAMLMMSVSIVILAIEVPTFSQIKLSGGQAIEPPFFSISLTARD